MIAGHLQIKNDYYYMVLSYFGRQRQTEAAVVSNGTAN